MDEAQLQIYAPNLSAQDKQALKDGTGCLVKNPIAFSYGDTTVQQTDLTVGDTIQLGDRTLPVLGLIDTAITINNDGFTNGVQLIVNDEIYCSLLGNDSYSEVYPTLQDNADTDTFESWLDSWCSNYPGTHWLSYLSMACSSAVPCRSNFIVPFKTVIGLRKSWEKAAFSLFRSSACRHSS